MKKLVSRSDFARLCGVSPAAVTKACRGKLAPACKGDRIDVNHPAAKAYLAAHKQKRPSKDRVKPKARKPQSKPARAKTSSSKPGRKRRTSSTAAAPEDAAPPLNEDGLADEILDLTVREVAERWGTSRSYVDWLEAYQKQQRARDLWLKNEQAEGSLISRELVETHVFGAMEALSKRLLTDAVKTLAARLYSLAKSGAPLEQAETDARELVTKQLRPVKSRVVRVLRKV